MAEALGVALRAAEPPGEEPAELVARTVERGVVQRADARERLLQVHPVVEGVDDAWGQYQTEATADGAPATIVQGITTSIAALDRASGAKQPTETMQAANDLSAGVVELYGLYEIGRPVGIGRLDVIGRQIVFDAVAKDQSGVQAELGKARSEWSAIEADLAGRGGQEVIDQTNGLLDAMDKQTAAGDLGAVAANARDFLEVVDAMEQLY